MRAGSGEDYAGEGEERRKEKKLMNPKTRSQVYAIGSILYILLCFSDVMWMKHMGLAICIIGMVVLDVTEKRIYRIIFASASCYWLLLGVFELKRSLQTGSVFAANTSRHLLYYDMGLLAVFLGMGAWEHYNKCKRLNETPKI